MTVPGEPFNKVSDIIRAEQVSIGDRAEALVSVIRARHGDDVKALLFYGSSLRAGEQSGKMLDFYVLVDSYKSVYGSGLKRFFSFLAPPGVHYCEADGPGGERLRSKYSIVSLPAFRRRARGGALESMLWARFAQPTRIVTDDDKLREELIETVSLACRHFLAETAPLLSGAVTPKVLWARGLEESYRTELRPEDAEARAAQIVENDAERYIAIAEALYPLSQSGDALILPDGPSSRRMSQFRWFLRRVVGKPMGAFRVMKAFFTFDAGLDYLLEKISSHSGVEIEVSDGERKRPLLHAPVLAWRLYRRGAFR